MQERVFPSSDFDAFVLAVEKLSGTARIKSELYQRREAILMVGRAPAGPFWREGGAYAPSRLSTGTPTLPTLPYATLPYERARTALCTAAASNVGGFEGSPGGAGGPLH